MKRAVNYLFLHSCVYRYGVVLIGGGVAAKFEVCIIASAKELPDIGAVAYGIGGSAGITAGGKGEIFGERGAKLFIEIAACFKAKLNPLQKIGIGEIAPEVRIIHIGQLMAGALFKLGAAMRAGAGVHMHIVYGIIRHKTIYARIGDKAPCV